MWERHPRTKQFLFDLFRELCPAAKAEPSYHGSANRFDFRFEFGDRQLGGESYSVRLTRGERR